MVAYKPLLDLTDFLLNYGQLRGEKPPPSTGLLEEEVSQYCIHVATGQVGCPLLPRSVGGHYGFHSHTVLQNIRATSRSVSESPTYTLGPLARLTPLVLARLVPGQCT